MQSAFFRKTLGVAVVACSGIWAQQSLAQSANCSYSISNEWSTGATAAITITNTSTTAINGWTVGWQYATNRLSGSWNANVSGNNPYTASNLSWNGSIPPGQSVQFGFQVDKRGGSAERPTITGSICGGARSSAPSSVAVSSVRSSSSIAVSSSVRSSAVSSAISGQQCNWYGTIYPLCVNTQNGWGYENNKSCISRTTCASQPAPWGIVGGSSSQIALSSSSRSSSSAMLSSVGSSSLAPSSSSAPSSVAPSSSSSVASSVVISSSSVASSVVASSSSVVTSSSLGTSSSVSSSIANNIAVNGDVESGTTNWGTRGAATIVQSTADRYAGNASLFVSGRTAYWNGATFSVKALTAGNSYEVAAWVKLAPGELPETIKLTGKLVDDADTATYNEYTEIASAQVSANGWTLLRGTYTPSGSTPFESFIVESVDGSVNVSFFVDNFSVAGDVNEPPPVPVGSGLSSLVNFPIGVAVAAGSGAADIFTNTARQNIVREEFSQIVAENIMKMSYMYSGGNFSFTNADRLANWAASNGKSLHGHALVWHPSYQLPTWATDTNANFRTDFARHIDTVAAHFAGKVKSWDVVNEALFDAADDDGRGSANGYRQSVFYRQYAGPSYIDEAFRRARAADPTAELYYNDFNTEENGTKTTALVNLVQRLLTNGAPIDGVGFQMHVMNDYPSIANIRASLQKIVDLSPTLKIKISELDVRINNPYDGNTNNDFKNRSDCAISCTGLDRQKARYKEIIQAYLDIVPPARRGGVVVWGIADLDSWFYTNQNLPDWPLMFNDSLQKKPAYQGVAEALAAVPRASSSATSSSHPSSSSMAPASSVAPSSVAPSSVAPSSVAPSSVTPSSRSSVATTSSIAPSSSSIVTASSVRSSIGSSSSRSSVTPGVRLDNPFVDARWYVDPIWSAKAQAEPGGSKVAGYSTAVWMDRIGAIAPADGSWGLRDHLDAALDQNANVIKVVVYDLPNRDCHALASNGELKQGVEGSTRYRTEYVDALVSIFSDPKYASLRIIAIIEPDSLPNLVTNLSTPACQQAADATYGYVANTRYTLSKLYPLTNVYSYVDIGHSGWLGWTDNFGKAVTLIGDAIKGATGGVNSVAGFVSNTSGYTPLYEPFLDSLANSAFPGSGGGTQTRQAKFYEWNPQFSEVAFVQAWRSAMISAGFPSSIGMLVDTSRNGWGGANRPTVQSTSTVLDTFVDQSRIDRRAHRGNWCNQPGGVGERPQTAPAAGIDAYVWVKPPGESDGAASKELSFDPLDPAKGFDRNCDPTYTNAAGTTTGAMANAPVAGRWFKEGFQVLINNAYPPLQ